MPLTGDGQVNKKACRIAINSRQLARFHPLDREKTVFFDVPIRNTLPVRLSELRLPFSCRHGQRNHIRRILSAGLFQGPASITVAISEGF